MGAFRPAQAACRPCRQKSNSACSYSEMIVRLTPPRQQLEVSESLSDQPMQGTGTTTNCTNEAQIGLKHQLHQHGG